MYDLYVVIRMYTDLKLLVSPVTSPPLDHVFFFHSSLFHNFYYPLSKSPRDLSDPLSPPRWIEVGRIPLQSEKNERGTERKL